MLWSDLERLGSFRDPWREFGRIRRDLSGWSLPSTVEFPAVNVWVSEENAVVTTEVPGIDPKSIDISLVGRSLTLRGSRQPEELKEGETYHRRERWHGQFSKTVALPFNIEGNKVEARFSNGVLSVTLPRAEAEKPRKINIKAD